MTTSTLLTDRSHWSGIIPPLVLGTLAWRVGSMFPILGAPVLAILLGLVVGQIFGQRSEWAAGVTFCSKKVLQTSIVLLGAGTAVNDTSSVLAAATVYGAAAASYAVVVKLTRTLAIIPLAALQSLGQNRWSLKENATQPVWYKLIPPFLAFFLLAAAINSLGILPESWHDEIKFLAHFGTTVAMAAVGMSSSFRAIRKSGWRPVALGGILWALVATSSLVLQALVGKI